MFYQRQKVIFVLTYHSIEDGEYLHSISPRIFEKQIEYVKQKYQPLSYEDFLNVIEGRKKLDRDGVLITFDDGVQDNFTNAFPILQRYNVPAVIFLSTLYLCKIGN